MNDAKSYEELKFTDDFMFCKVLSNNLPLCADIISLILGIKIREVRLAESQKTIEITSDGRGIRLDVYVEDEANTVFDLEMQTVSKSDIPKRCRYYQGIIDLNLIQRGAVFSELKKSYVIFICLNDALFGKGKPVYTFENMCNEIPGLILGDDTKKVIVNASSKDPDMTKEMKEFLRFLVSEEGNSKLISDIKEELSRARNRTEWRVEYMTLLMRDNEKRAEGKAEGLAEGRVEGLAEGRAEGLAEGRAEGLTEGRAEERKDFLSRITESIKCGQISFEAAAAILNIPVVELKEMIHPM